MLKKPPELGSSQQTARSKEWLKRIAVPIKRNRIDTNRKVRQSKCSQPVRFNFDPREIYEQGPIGNEVLQVIAENTGLAIFQKAVDEARLTSRQRTELYDSLEQHPDHPLLQVIKHLLITYDPAFSLEVGIRLTPDEWRDVQFALYINDKLATGKYKWGGKNSVGRAIDGLARTERKQLGFTKIQKRPALHKAYYRGDSWLQKHPILKSWKVSTG